MPDASDSTPRAIRPLPITQIQDEALHVMFELQRLGRRLERAQLAVQLPPNASQIWNGEVDTVLEIEVEASLAIIQDDLFAEAGRILYRAATATAEQIAEEARQRRLPATMS